jgi:hypothetical protein
LAVDKRIAQPRDRIVSVDLMPALAQVNLGISTGRFDKLQRVHARELGAMGCGPVGALVGLDADAQA